LHVGCVQQLGHVHVSRGTERHLVHRRQSL
jgi:hypothetical protein